MDTITKKVEILTTIYSEAETFRYLVNLFNKYIRQEITNQETLDDKLDWIEEIYHVEGLEKLIKNNNGLFSLYEQQDYDNDEDNYVENLVYIDMYSKKRSILMELIFQPTDSPSYRAPKQLWISPYVIQQF